MPTVLPNGTVIYNVTAHDLNFYVGGSEHCVVVPQDGIVNAAPETQDVLVNSRYTLVSVKFNPIASGWETINKIKGERADALIVGSMIAAQTYPGEVVASVPYHGSRSGHSSFKKMVRSDRFTVFQKEKTHNGR